MRRLSGLGVILASGFIAACGSSSPPPAAFDGGAGVAGGGGKGGAAAGATGHAGSGGAGGQSAGGAGGQSAGGAGGQSAGGAGGQSLGGAGGHASAGAGGQPAGGAGGQSLGGAGGHALGGAGGQPAGGAGGQSLGGATGACLDPSSFSSSFTIADSSFCAVAVYTAPESIGYQAPTWGSHGGPLVVQKAAGTGVTLERWTAPTGTTGTMTVQTTPVAAALPAGTFLGAQALDLPFFGWTAISWTNPSPTITGQFEMIASGAIATTYTAERTVQRGRRGCGLVAGSALLHRSFAAGHADDQHERLCTRRTPARRRCRLSGRGQVARHSALVAGWGDSTGPVATDSNGDVFAVMTVVHELGNQEARGFLASSVARGSAATTGVTLFTWRASRALWRRCRRARRSRGWWSFSRSTRRPLLRSTSSQQKFTTNASVWWRWARRRSC